MPVTINGTVLKFIMFVGALHTMAMFFKVTRQSAFKEWPFPNFTKTLLPQIMYSPASYSSPCQLPLSFSLDGTVLERKLRQSEECCPSCHHL